MVSEIEWTPKGKLLRKLLALHISTSIFVVVVSLLAPVPWPPYGGIFVLTAVLLFLYPVFYIDYRESWRDLINSLNFSIILDADKFNESIAQYNSVIMAVEDYLRRKRISYSSSFEGHKFGGLYLPYSKVFDLQTFNAKLKVKREKLGRFIIIARIIVGEVTDISEPFLRKLMEELRAEMEKQSLSTLNQNSSVP